MDSFKFKKCLLCSVQAVGAHVKTQGSGGDDIEENVIPLCVQHHGEQHNIGIISFLEKYPIILEYLISLGWELVEVFGRKKLFHAKVYGS